MSGALNNIYNNVNFALHLNTEAMTRLQEQASTGSEVNRISDDPSTAYRVLGLNSQVKSLENYTDHLSESIGILELSSTVVEEMISSFRDTKGSLTQISNGIYDETARNRAAEGIKQTLEQMVLLANSEHTDQYLFGGTNTGSAPYLVQRTNGEITSVTYQGSYEDRNIEVAPNVQSSAFYVGEDIFRSDNQAALVFVGDTGSAAGTGTSSVRDDTWLTVTGSAGNYNLSIDGGLSTVNTDGSHTNLAVTHSTTGEILYVNTTQINDTGVDFVRAPGTYDIFSTLIGIRDILNNDNNLSDVQVQEMLNNSLNSLDEMTELLVEGAVSIGSRIGFLDDLNDSIRNIEFYAKDETTRLLEADIAQIAIDLSRREVLYQMSLSVAARVMSMSLLDFLR
ncbi:MAG: flagellar hook-associated protein FlgL [Planctomycetota bacterium]|nr:flagellar hook-associated protein FlgL [Planctomycetota bacterium]